MKGILKLLLGLVIPIALQAAPTLVAHSVTSGITPSFSVSAMNNTGATLLVVYVPCIIQSNTLNIFDSSSNIWSSLTIQTTGGSPSNPVWGKLFYKIGPAVSASQTFTIGAQVDTACTAYIQAWSTTLSSGVIDVTNGAGGALGTTTTLQPGSITPTADGELLITGVGAYCITNCSTPTVSIGSGFTITDSTNSNAVVDGGLAYLIQSSAAPINPTWSIGNTSGGIVSSIVAFKVPAVAGATTYPGIGPFTIPPATHTSIWIL